ncbi:TetR/AcrR family transcriptional regulator [Propionibacterium cyclohexanicum]|uniref:TetR/AcrR family transcriptional regulator n=1 Tax=Propionibacterium cyclohexanicum TaxID=64702 RepID=UPI0015A587D5|nr:TetR/AcrR family transcriptional regulator [Propionibacterium cyclohexanicum]
MPKQTLSLRERQQEQGRADIIGAALEIIAESGPQAVSIDRLAEMAHMARATVYARFPDGLDAIISETYRSIGRDLTQRCQSLVSPATPWREVLMTWAREFFAVSAQPRVGTFYNLVGPRLVAASGATGGGSEATLQVFVGSLDNAVRAGELDSSAPVRAIARMLVGALRESGMAIARGELDGEESLEAFGWLVGALTATAGR